MKNQYRLGKAKGMISLSFKRIFLVQVNMITSMKQSKIGFREIRKYFLLNQEMFVLLLVTQTQKINFWFLDQGNILLVLNSMRKTKDTLLGWNIWKLCKIRKIMELLNLKIRLLWDNNSKEIFIQEDYTRLTP